MWSCKNSELELATFLLNLHPGQEPPSPLPAVRLQDALRGRADGSGAGADGRDAAGNLPAGPSHDAAGTEPAGMELHDWTYCNGLLSYLKDQPHSSLKYYE